MSSDMFAKLGKSIVTQAAPIFWNLAGAAALWIVGGFIIKG